VLSYLVKMIYKIHERIVGRNMRDERTIKLLALLIKQRTLCLRNVSYALNIAIYANRTQFQIHFLRKFLEPTMAKL